MSVKMLLFEYRQTEHDFFEKNKFENYDIKFFDFNLTEETLNQIPEDDINQAMIISVFINSSVTEKVINSFKNLRIISIRATGYDNINKISCIKRNIAVLNVQNYGEIAVAEYTMGLIISLIRNIAQATRYVRNQNYWDKSFVGRSLKNMVLGVVGTGSIGASVCRLASAFGAKILAYDISPKNELIDKYAIEYIPLEDLIKNADIITLHLPYTEENYHMFSEKEFDMMKQNSFFINVSRGEIIDNTYLKKNLDSGKIIGAALDVVACETLCDKCIDFANKLEITSLKCLENSMVVKDLIKRENVIITPHIAYETQDAINYILQITFDNIRNFINGETKNRVF